MWPDARENDEEVEGATYTAVAGFSVVDYESCAGRVSRLRRAMARLYLACRSSACSAADNGDRSASYPSAALSNWSSSPAQPRMQHRSLSFRPVKRPSGHHSTLPTPGSNRSHGRKWQGTKDATLVTVEFYTLDQACTALETTPRPPCGELVW